MRSLVLVVACLVGCGEDSSGGPYVPLDQLTAAYKDAQCKHLVACGSFPDQATCIAAAVPSNFVVDPSTQAAVLMAKVYYDGGKAAACFDALAKQTCDRTDGDGRVPASDCGGLFRGTLHAGGACGLNTECLSGSCSTQCAQNAMCCQGTCVGDAPPATVEVAIGESCAISTHVCGADAYCDTTATCAALKTAGMTCSTPLECDFGLYCVSGAPASTCKPLPTLGQPCPDFQCRDEGQYCSTTTQQCTQLGLPGSTCASTAECSAYDRCDPSMPPGKCVTYPHVGESCATVFRCNDAGTYCDTSAMPTCVPTKAEGATCTSTNECTTGICDASSHVCTTLPVCT